MKVHRVLVIFMSWLSATCSTDAQPSTNEVMAALKACPPAERPARAAALVKGCKRAERTMMATNVVLAALRMNTSAAPLVVGAIARAAPEAAAVSAQAAASEQPARLQEITRATVAVAPERAGPIVLALCRAVPGQYKLVAVTTARLVPAADAEILDAVSEARPELKPYIDAERSALPLRHLSVAACLESAEAARLRSSAALEARSKPLGRREPASESAPGASKDKPPHGNGKPPGGRNYARP